MASSARSQQADGHASVRPDSGYSWYALGFLFVVYMVNFIDRQILAILAEDIKADLGIGDANLGFLYGTAFAIFYALFGIPLGRLADQWFRGRLIGLGLALWSTMTVLSGFASSFAQLAVARVGVGVGEASASPAAYSLLSDYFSKRKRGLALAVYSAGLFVGSGLSLPIGGYVSDSWRAAFPEPALAPLGLAGWQAAFIAVGLPGLLLAAIAWMLREPVRGQTEGVPTPATVPGAWRRFGAEVLAIVPPLTLIAVARQPGLLLPNLAGAGLIAVAAFILTLLTGDANQWIALGVGFYAVFSWAQLLSRSDAPTFALIWKTPAFLMVVLAYGGISVIGYSVAFWTAPYAIRTFGFDAGDAGLLVGIPGAIGSALGVIAGGRVSDMLRERRPTGRVLVGYAAALSPILFIPLVYSTASLPAFVVLFALLQFFVSCWLGAAAATGQDLVLPRMRGTATATFFVGTTMIGLALGPYMAGLISEATGSLRQGLLWLLAVVPVTLTAIIILHRRLEAAEASRGARALAAGEPQSIRGE